MAYIKDYGLVKTTNSLIVKAKVANTGTIAKNDIVVLDAVGGATGAGYVKKWSAVSDAVVGVALEAVATTLTLDGDKSILVALAVPQNIFYFTASGVTQADQFSCCDISGVQAIDITSDTYQNVWITEVDTDNSAVHCILSGPLGSYIGVSATIDYGVA